jgi:hypothetical protein
MERSRPSELAVPPAQILSPHDTDHGRNSCASRDRRERDRPRQFPEKNLHAPSRLDPDDNASPPREKLAGCGRRFHWAQHPGSNNNSSATSAITGFEFRVLEFPSGNPKLGTLNTLLCYAAAFSICTVICRGLAFSALDNSSVSTPWLSRAVIFS